MTRRISPWAMAVVFAVAGLTSVPHAHAIPPFLKEFEAKYVKPDSQNDKEKAFAKLAAAEETGKCNLCHIKDKPKTERNPYGAALSQLLKKDNFKKERLEKEAEAAQKEIVEAFEKVAAQKFKSDDEKSPTFGALIAEGQLPGVAPAPAPEQVAEKKPEEKPAEAAQAPPAAPAPPATAAVLANQFVDQLKGELKAELVEQLKKQLETELRPQLYAELKGELKAQIKESLKPVIYAEMNAPKTFDPKQEQDAIQAFTTIGGAVRELAQNDDSKNVDFHLGGSQLADNGLEGLRHVSKLVQLNLQGTQITDAGMVQLQNLISLKRLNLARTKVGDEGIAYLKGLDGLEYLNLYGTQVTDAGLKHLQGMTNLRRLYLWDSKVTADGAKRLRLELPHCEVNLGAE